MRKGFVMKAAELAMKYIAADILCMFIVLTFAPAGNTVFRYAGLACSAGVMAAMMISFAASEANKYGKGGAGAAEGIIGTAFVPLTSWGVLMASVGAGFDYYKWHKLLNADFLYAYNLIEHDASSSALSFGEVLLMLVFAVMPPAVYGITYALVRKGVILSKS